MIKVVKDLADELQRLEKCDDVLMQLFRHHHSQIKYPCATSEKYHKELCDKIIAAQWQPFISNAEEARRRTAQ